jgi:hypothetical protein
MSIRKITILIFPLLALGLISGLALPSSVSGHSNFESAQPSVLFQEATPYNVYLPFVSYKFPPPETVFGVEMYQISTSGGLDQMSANTTWVRRNALLWADVEPIEGDRNWDVLAGLEQELKDASAKNLQTILIVRKTPLWAQKVPGYSCGPVLSEKLEAFGNIMYDLVSRYSIAPYNVKYWEIWNEPDVPPELAGIIGGSGIPFGCWGNTTDDYYGGGYYAEMLKAIYPRIKAANVEAQVIIGGLLLDCDPRGTPSVCASMGHDERPPKFLEGILRNGGGAYFDGVGFHNYETYYGSLGIYGTTNWNSFWNTTGTSTIAKAQFIREVLNAYGITGKFIMNTETGLVCGGFNDKPGTPPCDEDPASDFEQTKAYFITQEFAAAIAENLRADIWFSVFGWRNSGLLYPDGTPRPAYNSYQFAHSELENASFAGIIGDDDTGGVTGIKGYKFEQDGHPIWLIWSLDGAIHSLTFSMTPAKVFDVYGNVVSIVNPLNINLMPVYIEW